MYKDVGFFITVNW